MNTPMEAANQYVRTGKAKVSLTAGRMFLLAMMAGAFIAFGAVGATAVAVSIPQASLGKLLGACVFPGGLMMVLCAGSELFTGNCLLVIPLLKKEIRVRQMLRSWAVVYLGNMAGAMAVAAVAVFGHQADLFGGGMAVSMLSTAAAKSSLSFGDAFWKGVACNFLVCIAVWVGGFVAKTVTGRLAGLYFPILLFVVSGFEHSVANMYYIAAGLFARANEAYATAATAAGVDLTALSWRAYLMGNLLPVTLGNLIGGSLCVGCVYWYVYLSKTD